MGAAILDANGTARTLIDTRPARRGTELIIRDVQDCGEVIERCTAARNADSLRGHRRVETYRCVAELPVVLVDLLRAQGLDVLRDREALRRVLNDPAFKAFRCTEGRV